MAVWNLFLSSILLPLIAIVLLWRRPRRPLAGWWATLILAIGLVGFSVLAAPWGWFGLPLRFVIVALFALAIAASLRRAIPEDQTPESAVRNLAKVFIGLFFGGVAVGVLRAHVAPSDTIDLAMPMQTGTYLVEHGGSAPTANVHYPQLAVDFVKLNRLGMRAQGILPADPRRYAIFGEPVVSPCDGIVISAAGGFADAAPDPKHPLGNAIVLRCGDATVTLSQLQRGSVVARAGTHVGRGTPLARAGSSGISPEPHLHVVAERGGKPLGMRFGGRWLVRNAIVTTRRSRSAPADPPGKTPTAQPVR